MSQATDLADYLDEVREDGMTVVPMMPADLVLAAQALRSYEADQRDAVLDEAAKVCEDMQIAKDATVPDGKWRTLGDTEIDGREFAVAIRALKRQSAPEGKE